MEESSCVAVSEILVCGGLGQNSTFLQCLADVAALPVRTSTEDDPVLVGAAMLAAAASSSNRNPIPLRDVVVAMAGNARTTHPSTDINGQVNK